VSKKFLSAIAVLAAVTVPTAALAATTTKTTKTKTKTSESKAAPAERGNKAGIEKEGNRYQVTTPEITTTRGSENPPMTDVGELSTRARRDFVKDPTGISGAANLGFGFGDSYGLGLGARLGYTLPARVYLGGLFGYYLGNTAETQGIDIKNKSWHVGGEVGYDVGIGRFLLRPVLGVGVAFRNQRFDAPPAAVAAAGVDATETDTRVFVSPGVSLNYPIGNFFVGADSRAMLMSGNSTLTLLGAVGAHL
jgi:hypothetical protein